MAESEGGGRQSLGQDAIFSDVPEDTDEQFQDHPEYAPRQGMPAKERVKRFESMSIRRRANTGDIVDYAGDRHFKMELDFSHNHDFGGDQGTFLKDEMRGADEARGSGFLGGKLHGGYESSGETEPEEGFSSLGFPYSDSQVRNIEAIQKQEQEVAWEAVTDPVIEGLHRGYPSQEESLLYDSESRLQVTGTQAFGRDIGASGLSQADRESQIEAGGSFQNGPDSQARFSEESILKAKAAVLRRLGGSSPGSFENIQLLEKFGKVMFPAYKSEVLHCLSPGAELRTRGELSISLRDAVVHSRSQVFRNLNDLVDCVKDELRRVEMSAPA
jgi:hypothetical protein